MHDGLRLVAFGIITVAALTGTAVARRRVRRRWEQTGGFDREKDVRWNMVLFAAIVVPALILMVAQLLLR